jgi:hypothetical protein
MCPSLDWDFVAKADITRRWIRLEASLGWSRPTPVSDERSGEAGQGAFPAFGEQPTKQHTSHVLDLDSYD